MAPSGFQVPQRFRQLEKQQVKEMAIFESREAQMHWEELLERRKRCKDKYNEIKQGLEAATASLRKFDHNSAKSSEQEAIKLSSRASKKGSTYTRAEVMSQYPAEEKSRSYTHTRNANNSALLCNKTKEFKVHHLKHAVMTFNYQSPEHYCTIPSKPKCEAVLPSLADLSVALQEDQEPIFDKESELIVQINSLSVINDWECHENSQKTVVVLPTPQIMQSIEDEEESVFSSDEEEESESWEYYNDSCMLLTHEEAQPFRSNPKLLTDPYAKEACFNLHPDCKTMTAMLEWTRKMTDKNFNLVQHLNALLGLEGLQVVKESIYCKKLEAIIGYTESSIKINEGESMHHGFFREVKRDKVTSVGLCINGQPLGHSWQRLDGDAFIVNLGSKMVYIYPDLTNALYGQRIEGQLKNGKFAKVMELDCHMALPLPKVKRYHLSATFCHDISTTVTISLWPMLRDPYEQQTCYIEQSRIHPEAGEGLFAKRYLPKGSLVAIFNGVRLREVNGVPRISSDYKICLQRGIDLDIPNWAICLKKYCATLAHKACHSFSPNSGFLPLEHPRFGKCMSIVTLEDIEPNQEIFVNYNYRIWQAPEWYQAQWIEHKRIVENTDEKTIFELVSRIRRDYGTIIDIPIPDRSSPRFSPCPLCKSHVAFNEPSVLCIKCQCWVHFECIGQFADNLDNDSDFVCKKCEI